MAGHAKHICFEVFPVSLEKTFLSKGLHLLISLSGEQSLGWAGWEMFHWAAWAAAPQIPGISVLFQPKPVWILSQIGQEELFSPQGLISPMPKKTPLISEAKVFNN